MKESSGRWTSSAGRMLASSLLKSRWSIQASLWHFRSGWARKLRGTSVTAIRNWSMSRWEKIGRRLSRLRETRHNPLEPKRRINLPEQVNSIAGFVHVSAVGSDCVKLLLIGATKNLSAVASAKSGNLSQVGSVATLVVGQEDQQGCRFRGCAEQRAMKSML